MSSSVTKITHRDEHILGAGACGVVYRGLVSQPGALQGLKVGQLVAVKRIPIISTTVGKAAAKKVEQEVGLLQSLQHANIVRYYGTVREDHSLSIVMEYAEGGSLHSLYRDFGALAESIVKSYTFQMLKGLEYLHSKNVVHRDIKSMNVLLDKQGHIMLADFGCSCDLSTLAEKKFKSMAGSLPWMAPEVLKMNSEDGAGFPSDIWSLGCTVWEILAGRMPFSDFDNEFHMMCHIVSCDNEEELLESIDFISNEALRFVLRCLKLQPELRPTATELLQDPWLAGLEVASPSSPMSPGHVTSGTTAPPKSTEVATTSDSKIHAGIKWWQEVFGPSTLSVPSGEFLRQMHCETYGPKILPLLLGFDTVTKANFINFVQWFGPWEVLRGALGGNKSRKRGTKPNGYEGEATEDPYGYGDGYHYTFRYPTHIIRLIDASWFHPLLQREQCESAMQRAPPGTYCIRFTSSAAEFPGGYTLSLRGESQVHHYRITRPQAGWEYIFRNGDQDMTFKGLHELVAYYQVHDIINQRNNRTYRLVAPFES